MVESIILYLVVSVPQFVGCLLWILVIGFLALNFSSQLFKWRDINISTLGRVLLPCTIQDLRPYTQLLRCFNSRLHLMNVSLRKENFLFVLLFLSKLSQQASQSRRALHPAGNTSIVSDNDKPPKFSFEVICVSVDSFAERKEMINPFTVNSELTRHTHHSLAVKHE